MAYMTPKEAFIIIVFNINHSFYELFKSSGNSIYVRPDNEL